MKTEAQPSLNASPVTRKNVWIRIAGAAALLTLGYILYRKKQTGLGSALMTGSLNVLTSSVPEV